MVSCIRRYKRGFAWYSLDTNKRLSPIAALKVILYACIHGGRISIEHLPGVTDHAKNSPSLVVNWKESVRVAKLLTKCERSICNTIDLPDLNELYALEEGEHYIFKSIY